MLQIGMLLMSVATMHAMVDISKKNPTLSWIIVMGIVTFINYLGSKYWVFR